MEIIPVIDLKAGKVVHAKGGQRDGYLPVKSQLCHDGDSLTLIQNFSARYSFTRLYIADLDAITECGNHDSIIRSIRQQFPDIELWIDNGINNDDSLQQFYQRLPGRPVIGSETLTDPGIITIANSRSEQPVLSLDFSHEGFIGPGKLQTRFELWPDDVIVMSLDHVGSNQGPDFSRLKNILSLSNNHHVYAAGGIRNNQDLLQLSDAGIHGALVASALHSGKIML